MSDWQLKRPLLPEIDSYFAAGGSVVGFRPTWNWQDFSNILFRAHEHLFQSVRYSGTIHAPVLTSMGLFWG